MKLILSGQTKFKDDSVPLNTGGRNFARQVYTMIQKEFTRKVSLRFYAKSKFCVCFEVIYLNIPIMNSYLFGYCLIFDLLGKEELIMGEA